MKYCCLQKVSSTYVFHLTEKRTVRLEGEDKHSQTGFMRQVVQFAWNKYVRKLNVWLIL